MKSKQLQEMEQQGLGLESCLWPTLQGTVMIPPTPTQSGVCSLFTSTPSFLGRFIPVMYLHVHKVILLQVCAFNRVILAVTLRLPLHDTIKGPSQ